MSETMVANVDGQHNDKNPAKQGKTDWNPSHETRFKPGQSGNPRGTVTAGATIGQWLNAMASWSEEDLKKVLDDPLEPAAKKAAARTWVHAITKCVTNSGNPIAGAEFDRIMDRTIGKPQASVDLTSGGESIYKVLKGVSQDDL